MILSVCKCQLKSFNKDSIITLSPIKSGSMKPASEASLIGSNETLLIGFTINESFFKFLSIKSMFCIIYLMFKYFIKVLHNNN